MKSLTVRRRVRVFPSPPRLASLRTRRYPYVFLGRFPGHESMVNVRICFVVAVLCCFLTVAAFAQMETQDAKPGDERTAEASPPATIVVSAPAVEDGFASSPGVLTFALLEIADTNTVTLADVIDRIPGLQLQRQGSRFEPSTFRIRGSEAGQILVLRNGRFLSDSRSAAVDVSRVSLIGIERIEVVYGPATALYGFGGAAGAINLVSERSGTADTGSGYLSWGSLSEYRGGATTNVAFATGGTRHEIEVEAEGAYTENTYRFERNGTVEKRVNAGGYDAQGRGGYRRVTSRTEMGIEGSIARYKRGLPGTFEFPSDSASLEEQRGAVRGDLGVGDRVTLELGAVHNFRHFLDEDYPLGAFDSSSTLTGIDGTVRVHAAVGSFHVVLPLFAHSESVDDSDIGIRRRTGFAVAPGVATTVSLPTGGAVGFEATGRIEAVGENDRGPVTLPSGRGGIDWTAAAFPLWTGVAVSAGYRLPDFSELFTQGSAFAVGNPSLEPEESRGIEVELRAGDFFVQPAGEEIAPLVTTGLRIALFFTRYEELIQWLPNPTGVWRPRNTGAAEMYGLESEGSVGVPLGSSPWDATVTAGLDLLQARERTGGVDRDNQLPYRPQVAFRGAATIEHLFGHRIRVEATGRGARPITRQNTVWLDPYIDLSIGGRFAILPNSAYLGVTLDNIFDERYVESRFYPNPGREIRISLEVVW